MKLIQIVATVAALAVGAAAQNTGTTGQTTGSGTQTKATDKQKPKSTATTTSGKTKSGKSTSTASGSQGSGITMTVPKTGSQTSPSGKTTASSGTTTASSGKATPVLSVASNGKTGGTGSAAKTGAAQTSTKTTATNTTANKTATTGKTNTPATAQKKPVVTAKTSLLPAKKTKSPATTATTAKKVVPKQAVKTQKKDQVKVVSKNPVSKPAAKQESAAASAHGRRDPFMSVIRTAPSGPTGPNCSVGKRCLYIPELVLKGIAKDTDGQMLAVVVSNTHRAYFLRENDQVFNGSVEKITSDSIVFREFAVDHLGKETAHEIVKRIPKT